MADRAERLRDRAHAQMLHILRFGETITEDTTIEAIKARLEILEARYQTFNEMELQLFEKSTYESITNEVDEVYYKARDLLSEACGRHGRGGLNINPDLNNTLEQFFDQQKTFYEGVNTAQQVRLPKINIEPFSGDYTYWASFHDLFKTTVHNNKNISDVHKLQMLKSLLKGEASSLIRHISITEANYIEAWEKLCNRYNKMTPIVTTLVQTFMEQKPCIQSNGKELRRISETSDEQLWANESVDKDFPTVENLLTFLNKRCDALEICESTVKRVTTRTTSKSFVATQANPAVECTVCKQQHPTFKCPEFKNMSWSTRSRIILEKNLCGNCLKKGHTSEKCYSKSSCLICRKRHHTLIHQQENDAHGSSQTAINYHVSIEQPPASLQESSEATALTQTTKETIESTQTPADKSINTQSLHTYYSSTNTVLPTAMIFIKSRTGELQLYRVLLDSGSQTSFVTESCAQSLGLKRSQSSLSVYGLASSSAGKTRGKIDMTIHSRIDKNYQLNVTAHILNHITKLLPTKSVSFNKTRVPVELADPQFYESNKIDVLLGADIFFEILNPEEHVMDGLPKMRSSKFGWLIAGSWNNSSPQLTNLHVTTDPESQITNADLHRDLKSFWEVEEIASHPNTSITIHECETFYEKTTTRSTNGQFIVKLPFKTPTPALGSSYQAAHQRLLAMERRFSKAPEFYQLYKSFINEYIAMEHMNYLPIEAIPTQDNKKYYLPHHAVVKSSSSTGLSLNNILQVGPNIQSDLTTIILQFRRHAIAMVADIEKMYRQILIDPDDANFQLILWREHPMEQVKTYKLNTVTYGTACAPFLAIKTLKRSTESAGQLYPTATHIINNEFYMDDLLTGCDNVQEAVTLKEQLNSILRESGFNLRKWKSNSPEFLKSFSQQEVQNIPKLIEDDSTIKTLGIIWDANLDNFSFKVQTNIQETKWTKRKILSAAAKLYDPLGWLAPTIILFKLCLQKLWLLKLDWDDSVPTNIRNLWQGIYNSLVELETIQIPRRLTTLTGSLQLQLHAFCDASEAAYGSVIYLRAINELDEITVNIIIAKNKVAPIKQISLPRLELCGAVMLAKLTKYCIESLSYSNIQVFAWTDSMIVLHWLSDFPRRWKSFVGNRTAAILETVPRNKWQHVDSKDNPADAITRGAKPKALPSLQLWWKGPHWLQEPAQRWPKQKSTTTVVEEESLEERSKYINVLTSAITEEGVVLPLLARISSWYKIRKVVVYILRFGRPTRLKVRSKYQRDQITPSELEDAEVVILRNVQQAAFKTEIAILTEKSPLSTRNQLSSLDPFIDSNGLLRVGGRLRKSSLPYATMHPVILPNNHVVCEKIIRSVHFNNMHAGNSLTLIILRSKYWVIGARYMIKRCIKLCTVCIRYRFHKNEQKMADLPAERCNQSRPFLKTGLDYAGPLYIKTSKRKTSITEKAYVAVFVCLAVKAVHLEVVSSLNSESFLAALRRFIARRGSPQQIWCDNGSNFVGANRELQQLKQQIIAQSTNPLILEFLLQKGINFQFNPPHAPHFGGLWESSVRSFKYHLRRVTNINLTFEEMTTLIIQIESLLNSRPLCRLNDDPADLQILTPAHFLVGEALTIIPEPMLAEIPQNKLSRWQNIQQRVQGFWSRWHQDYLTTLQQRFKWKTKTEQLAVDDVVLIREDNLYPSQWLLGMVTAIHPGSDGITRVVTLKTTKNNVKRPVNKLIKLPIK